MYHEFNIQQFYFLPIVSLCVLCGSEKNSDHFPIQHKLTGFYNRNRVCLLRGTDWISEHSLGATVQQIWWALGGRSGRAKKYIIHI